MTKVKGTEITCHICGYEWSYNGNAKMYATCPACLRKTKIDKAESEEDGE